MELKACREALKSGNKPAADELLCIKEFSMEQVKAIEEKDGRIICDFILSNGAVDRDFDTVNPDGWELENFRKNPCLLYTSDAADELLCVDVGGRPAFKKHNVTLHN